MKNYLVFLSFVIAVSSRANVQNNRAVDSLVIPLYSGIAPGSETWDRKEIIKEVDGPRDAEPRKTHFILNVTNPNLTVFPADPTIASGAAVIVCPGGGYSSLAIDYEGTEVAHWFSSHGITAFVLKYRVNQTDEQGKLIGTNDNYAVDPYATADGLKAMQIIRSRAKEWNIDTGKVGIIGFSAGGWVGLAVATAANPALRANFFMSIYSGTLKDLKIPSDAGPLFEAVASNDKMVLASLNLFSAWQKAGISSEIHVYATGSHGFSFVKRHMPVDSYLDRLKDWLVQMGYLK